MKYSPSSVNKFFQCPYSWKLEKVDRVQGVEAKNDRKLLGKNIHLIIQDYFSNIIQKPTAKQIEYIAMASFNSLFEDKLKKHRALAEQMIKNFIKFERSRLPNYIKPLFVEKTLEDENFQVIIDFFDGTQMVDWKTGAIAEIDEDLRRQGKICDLVLKHNGFNGNHKIIFYILLNGRSLELPFTSEVWITEQTQRMFRMVASNQYPKCIGPLCDYCDVQLECEFEGINLWDLCL